MSGLANNPLELSDEDFLNMNGPPVADAAGDDTVSGSSEEDTSGEDTVAGAASPDIAADAGAAEAGAEGGGDEGSDGEGDGGSEGAADAGAGADAPGDAAGSPNPDAAPEPKADGAPKVDTPSGSQFTIPTTIQANGKQIELKSPEEAVQLMQMGANYTRKMQELAPHRKTLLMLQTAGIDETKLSFLIDLDKKDPEAIKKLIKDSGIDPLEIDMSTEPAYVDGVHTVTDQEANFRTAISELSEDPAGKETLVEINGRWDATSKEVLGSQPEILAVIHQQRVTGVYDAIVAEMDRRITLGAIPAGTPFLQAYKDVGDELAKAALENRPSGQSVSQPAPPQKEPVKVDQRVAAPKSQVANSDKASAASPTRSSPGKSPGKLNPLALSDDDFLKQMEGRV